jgi:hypothetical protein
MSDINITVNDEIVNIDIVDEPVLINVVNSPGVPGAPGQGVPVGGTTGQVLKKLSNTNYDTYWAVDAGGISSIGLTMPAAFNVANSPLTANGTLAVTGAGSTTQYIDGTGALQTFPLTLPVLQEVRNQTGATLDAGTVVYINGATGNKPTVTKAIATGDATSAQTLGMVSAAIANNGTGYVVVIGTCSGLDTSAFTEGQQLYLSYTTAGAVTTTKPYAPYHLVYIGIVTRAHPTLGTVEVRVQNGYELDEIHDVDALNPNNNDGIFYNTSTSLWEHKQISTALGYTPANAATTLTINGVTYDLSTSRTYSVGTVTSVSALTIGTSGTDITSSVANGTTTPVITLNIPTASATNRGALSSTDWITFNGKQGALTLTTTGTSGPATLIGTTLNIPQYSGGGGMAIGGSITSATAGSVLFVGSGGVLAQSNANFFWDATNGRLGIGTNAPSQKLHISNGDLLIERNDSFTGFIVRSTRLTGGEGSSQFFLQSQVGDTNLRFLAYGDASNPAAAGTYVQSANYARTGNMPLVFSGYNGNIGSDLTFKFAKVMFTDGVALFGSNTSTGEKLQVTGTMKVTGASSFGGNMTLSLNQNAATTFMISNTTVGTSSDVSFVLTSTNGIASFAKYNSSRNPYKILSSNDAFLYNGTSGDLAIFNDFASGNIKFAAGGSSTAQMTIKSNGRINMSSLPTSSSGLATGDLWNDSGTIKIV